MTPTRVALLSVGLGRVQRGFERWASDLFGMLRHDIDITLFKGGGRLGQGERVPAMFPHLARTVRALPAGKWLGDTGYKRDCVAFGLGLLPALMRERFDVIHFIDPPLAVVLFHLRRIFRFRSCLLFTEGAAIPPEYYPRVDHLHHVSHVSFEGALDAGVPKSHMTLVPSGIHTDCFPPGGRMQELRRKYGIPESTFVILVVSAVNRDQKRVDYVIEEVSPLRGDVLLWIDGNPEDPTIPALAERLLGSRCRFTHVPTTDVHELYQLADVLVHARLGESFGLAVVEAMSSGLMVLAHDSPHFEWLIQDRECLVDMRVPGLLSKRLGELASKNERRTDRMLARSARVRERFDWKVLAPAYVEMYRRLADAGRSRQD